MIKQLFACLFIVLFFSGTAFAQTDDPVLFTVENVPVTLSEFKYIYSKTNQDKADFSRESLEEYLRLYTNFKLKVYKAREMKLDTVPQTQRELEGYRRQLANSYLVDKEVTNKLVEEVYEHMKKDIDISYIFIACDQNAPAADTLKAYNRVQRIYKALKGGADFAQMAVDSSDDKGAKENKGRLGFVTAMFPNGFYNLEKAAYDTKPGSFSKPVRTATGYNIVMVHAEREARGEIEAAHILVRKGEKPALAKNAKLRIDSAYAALQGGMNWDAACLRFSDDETTKSKGGYIGFFGINRYQKGFENAAFALSKEGEYCKPVETTVGWHIVKLISRRPLQPYEKMKRALTTRIKRDSRSGIAKASMINRIKKEGDFEEYPKVLEAFIAEQTDSVFHTFRWKPNPEKPEAVLFTFNDKTEFAVADFEDYCARAGRERMRGKGYPVEETVRKLYKAWVEDCAMQFEESQLDKKYPEFRSLMREYREGILLFEAAKVLVWDRANTDSTGLQAYFDANLQGKYKWDERARVSFYTIKTTDEKQVARIQKYIAKKPSASVAKKFNKMTGEDLVVALEKTYEKGKNKEVDAMWKAGSMSPLKYDEGTNTTSFIKVEEIIPPTDKKLNEARGYAVAEYQDFLEKQWVEDLRKEYEVNVNQQVFESLIK